MPAKPAFQGGAGREGCITARNKCFVTGDGYILPVVKEHGEGRSAEECDPFYEPSVPGGLQAHHGIGGFPVAQVQVFICQLQGDIFQCITVDGCTDAVSEGIDLLIAVQAHASQEQAV